MKKLAILATVIVLGPLTASEAADGLIGRPSCAYPYPAYGAYPTYGCWWDFTFSYWRSPAYAYGPRYSYRYGYEPEPVVRTKRVVRRGYPYARAAYPLHHASYGYYWGGYRW